MQYELFAYDRTGKAHGFTGFKWGYSVRAPALHTAVPASVAPLALGAWVPGAGYDPTVIDSFAALVGAVPGIVMWYQAWGAADYPAFPAATLSAYAERGVMPLITWDPAASSGGLVQPAYSDAAIAAGAQDAYVDQWARAAAAWGKPLYLRYGPEMNGNWTAWSVGVNGNTAAGYVAAWRHVHDIFARDGASNVRWVWCPNIEYPGSTPFADVYPGDAYVDWVALDGYNWGPSFQWHAWQSLAEIIGPSYTALAAMTGKPMMIGETASSEVGGDKAAWITQGFLSDLPSRFPRVRAVVWFQESKETDWRVNSSDASLAAFRQVAASPLYQGRLP